MKKIFLLFALTRVIMGSTDGNSIREQDWKPAPGGESDHITIDSMNNDIVYEGSNDISDKEKPSSPRADYIRVIEPMKGKDEFKDVNDPTKDPLDNMNKIEEELYQANNRSSQDPLNFPARLNNKIRSI